MNTLLGYFLAFILSISQSYYVSRKLKSSIAKILPFCLMGSTIVVYIFAMLGNLLLGYILIILSAVLPTALYWIRKRIKVSEELKAIWTPSLALICLVYVLLGAINFGRTFHAWDDFMHWGPFVKETYRNMALYNSEASLVEVHPDYPPIISLYESFWVLLSGKYNESILFISLQYLQLSFFFPFLDRVKWKNLKNKKIKFIGLAVALVLVPAIIPLGDDYFFVTIMTDSLIGMLFAFAMTNIIVSKKIDKGLLFRLGIIFAFLILVKQIAIAFIAVCVALLLIELVFSKQDKKIRIAMLSFATIVPALLLNYCWTGRVEELGIQGQFQISALVDGTMTLIKSRGASLTGWQEETIINFVKAYAYNKPIILGLSYFRLTLLFAVIGIIVLLKNQNNRKRNASIFGLIILASIAYAILMMLLYVFCFGEIEGPILASYDRYLGTFWYAVVILGFSVFLYSLSTKKLDSMPNLGVLAVLVFVLATSPASIALTLARSYDKNNYKADTQAILSRVQQGDKVYIVAQDSNGVHNVKLKYLLMPIRTSASFGEPYSFGPADDSGIYSSYVDPEDFKDCFDNYDYLYIYKLNPYFIEQYGKYFEQEPVSGGLYRVTDDEFELVTTRR